MFEFTCEGRDNLHCLTVRTDDFEKFDAVMQLIDSFDDGQIKKGFKIEDYPGRYVMHCGSLSAATMFQTHLCNLGKAWRTGRRYDRYLPWKDYGEATCYSFNDGLYGPIDFYKDEGYKILEFDDFNWRMLP